MPNTTLPPTTVLTLEPLDFNALGNTVKLQLRGKPCYKRQVIKVDYPASFARNTIDAGVMALDTLIAATPGPILVFGHSQGAQVASRWLRRKAALPGAPSPRRVSFLFIGNPLRKYGGYIVGRNEVDGVTGEPTPTDTPYPVTDVTLQYDGWSDYPTKPGMAAALNALKGKNGVHCYDYLTADLDDPARKTHTEGTTTFVLLPHKPVIPVPQSLIEKSYDRPER